MEALVTGASGFIGRHLVPQLLAAGTSVRAFVRPATAADPRRTRHLRHPRVRIIAGSLDDADALRQAARGVDWVYHLAFLYREAWAPDQNFYPANVRATSNVLHASARAGIRRFVLSGSVSVYGWPHAPAAWPIAEETPLRGRGSYATTKLEAERLVREFTQRHHLEHVILRIPHVYGRGAATIEYYLSLLIPPHRLRRRPARVVDPTLMFGRVWHFVHVSDVARGLVRAAVAAAGRNETFNMAGEYASTRAQLRRIVHRRLYRTNGPDGGAAIAHALQGPAFQLFDTRKAEALLRFSAQVATEKGFGDLLDGLLSCGAAGRAGFT